MRYTCPMHGSSENLSGVNEEVFGLYLAQKNFTKTVSPPRVIAMVSTLVKFERI